MSELLGIARFQLHEGRLEEFERLSARCMDIVRHQDTGTLQYDLWFDEQRTECIVMERYRDSDALLEHASHIGEELMAAIAATGSVSGDLFGDLSDELADQMADGPVRLFTLYRSL